MTATDPNLEGLDPAAAAAATTQQAVAFRQRGSMPGSDGKDKCEHVLEGTPALAYGMCRGCFVEYLEVSGGIFPQSSDPPAFVANLRKELQKQVRDGCG